MSQQGNAKIVENSQVLQCWTFKNPEQFTQKKATQFAIYEFKYKRRDSSSLRGKTFLAGKHFLQANFFSLSCSWDLFQIQIHLLAIITKKIRQQ